MTDPRRITDFEWDEHNTAHIARHQVTPEEVEDVFLGKFEILRNREKTYLALGSSATGRYLTVVFVVKKTSDGPVIRVITARPMSRAEKRGYAKRAKKSKA